MKKPKIKMQGVGVLFTVLTYNVEQECTLIKQHLDVEA